MLQVKKTISILQSLATIYRSSLPQSESNVDTFLHTYKFWKEVESIAKKQKEEALADIQNNFEIRDPKDYIKGVLYVLEYRLSERRTFDIELYKSNVKKRYPTVSIKVLCSLVEDSKSPHPFRTYKVKEVV